VTTTGLIESTEQDMPKAGFVEHNGTRHVVDVADGTTLMRAAVDNAVPGIDGDCGGQCACATCHVFIGPEWQAAVGARTEVEEEMLNFAAGTLPNSRLACQITLTSALDGLTVRMPEGQH
jgi:ferredoxin, 2Fe-2S